MPRRASPARPAGFVAARIIDVAAATTAIVALSPLLVMRGVAGRIGTGRWFESTPALGLDGHLVTLLDFSGRLPGRHMARLLNLFRGDVALGGPRPARIGDRVHWLREAPERFEVRPGLVAPIEPRRMMGIGSMDEAAADREFVACHRASSGLRLVARWTYARCVAGPADRPTPPFLDLLGVSMTNTTMAEAVDWLVLRARAGKRTFVAFANPDCLNIAQTDPVYRRTLQRADRVFADGIGVRVGARLLGQRMADNVNGTDLFPLLCEASVSPGLGIYLLGALPGVAEATADAMRARYPGLRIVGTQHGFFEDDETTSVVERINASGADILLVAMGAPRQEAWLTRHASTLRPAVRLGVGGLFDYYSGRIPRAPAWIREAGFEWTWRLACEPSRLWKRYVVGNPLFIARILASRVHKHHTVAATAIQVDDPATRAYAAARSSLRRRMPDLRERTLAFGKRSLDVAASGAAILALSPVLAGTALAIRLESPGPIIFRQQRVGRRGEPFTMLKFRSMFVDAEARKAALLARNEMAGGVIFKMKDDPRVTRVGRFIRRTSIDELPQLFNVLRGDMSLVGPRPPLPSEVAQYSLADRGRLEAAPGITCIWQVSGRSEIPFPQQVEMDIDYIHRQSLSEDVRLLLKTVPALVRGRGAY